MSLRQRLLASGRWGGLRSWSRPRSEVDRSEEAPVVRAFRGPGRLRSRGRGCRPAGPARLPCGVAASPAGCRRSAASPAVAPRERRGAWGRDGERAGRRWSLRFVPVLREPAAGRARVALGRRWLPAPGCARRQRWAGLRSLSVLRAGGAAPCPASDGRWCGSACLKSDIV